MITQREQRELPALRQTRKSFQHLFAGVLLVLAMAITFNAAIKWIERKAAIWQTGSRAGQRAADELTAGAMQPAT